MSDMRKKAEKKAKPDKGRAFRIGILCLLLAAAVFLLWSNGYFAQSGGTEPLDTSADDIKTPPPGGQESRVTRETAYDKDVSTLTLLSQNESVAPQTREDAAKQLSKMVEEHQTEVAIEDALIAAGFSPRLTLLQNGALTVMVEATELTSTESATILSLCAAHVDVGLENIRIMLGEE
jgi:hypothetical protein